MASDAQQLDLPLPRVSCRSHVLGAAAEAEPQARAQALSDHLARALEAPVRLVVTDNRSTVLRVRESDGVYHVRVHHLFLDAEPAVWDALGAWASGKGGRRAGRVLDAFIESRRDRIRRDGSRTPRAPADPRGEVHDLKAIFDELNAAYFGGQVVARIGWGRWGARRHRRRRSIKMGSYLHEARLIRIHPALDHPEVPRVYVAWVVYHEMLHQIVPAVRRGSRMDHHPPRFRMLEARYEGVEAARAWEAAHFDLLLRPAPRARGRQQK
jgi:hypothetical protein